MTGVVIVLVPPAPVATRVLLEPVLVDESVQVPEPAAPPSLQVTTPAVTPNTTTWPSVIVGVVMQGTSSPPASCTVYVLSAVSDAVDGIKKEPVPTVKLPPTVIVPVPESVTIELPIVVALVALGIVPVVSPLMPPVDVLPHDHVRVAVS